jgi:hypothetical protein
MSGPAQKSSARFEVKNDGVVLTATFDTASKSFGDDLKAFGSKLQDLQKKLGFSAFVRGVKKDGKKLIVKIIPAKLGDTTTDLDALMDDLEKEGGGAFEAAPRGQGRRPIVDVNAVIPEPSDDPALNDALKKALLIPRR